jgi:hypothetical protein
MESDRHGGLLLYERRIRCGGCGEWVRGNPRVKGQQYCGKPECQRVRRARWHRRKLITDEEYRQTSLESNAKWRRAHPDYWRTYRREHPEQAKANRSKQRGRNQCRRFCDRLIAKMYSFGVKPPETKEESGVVAGCPVIAKMYSFFRKAQSPGPLSVEPAVRG